MLGSLRKFAASKVAQHVDVHTTDAFITDLVPVLSTRKRVETYTFTPQTHVNVNTLEITREHSCKVEGFRLKGKAPIINGYRVKLFTKHDIKTHSMPKRKKINIFKAVKKMQALPIELEDKLRFQHNRPVLSRNEVILAWYWPIVDKAVIKLALDKQRSTLLVWYNPSSRHGRAKGLYLIRRLGLGEKPEWRWV